MLLISPDCIQLYPSAKNRSISFTKLDDGKNFPGQLYDNFAARGRKAAEEHLPNLLEDIKAIADGESQTDPTFKTTRLYIRLSATEVRQQLIDQKKYRSVTLSRNDPQQTQ